MKKKDILKDLERFDEDAEIIDTANFSHFFEFKEVCDGQDDIFGYRCCLKPNHDGDCFSFSKKVDFVREN